ncbi:MAG: hypothetical protein AB7K24_19470 [Gemmataceae bacterium]
MHPLYGSVGATAIATIYLIYEYYRNYLRAQTCRERLVRDRVCYMLWVMANETE